MARAEGPPKPQQEWDQLFPSIDFRELFQDAKNGAVRVYSPRVENGGASVWVNEETSGSLRTVERKKFTEPDAATAWLSNEEKRLGADGWNP